MIFKTIVTMVRNAIQCLSVDVVMYVFEDSYIVQVGLDIMILCFYEPILSMLLGFQLGHTPACPCRLSHCEHLRRAGRSLPLLSFALPHSASNLIIHTASDLCRYLPAICPSLCSWSASSTTMKPLQPDPSAWHPPNLFPSPHCYC